MDNSELWKEIEYQIKNCKPRTRENYRRQIKEFLDFCGDRPWFDKDDVTVGRNMVEEYIEYFKKNHSTDQSYINGTMRSCVGVLYRIKGAVLPVKLPHVDPRVYSEDNDALFWTDEQVEAIVEAAKHSDSRTKFFMAIATVYAPRVGEIEMLHSGSINKSKAIIKIKTEKHNATRIHLIPEEIQPILFGYEWEKSLTKRILSYQLRLLCEKNGIERKMKQLYHAFRHSLWDELSYSGLSESEIYKFSGWKTGGTLGHYVRPFAFNPKNDKRVFDNHPFLGFWR